MSRAHQRGLKMSAVESLLMTATLAKADLEFAISKLCQAKLAEVFCQDRLVGVELTSAREALDRAALHLTGLAKPGESAADAMERAATGNVVPT